MSQSRTYLIHTGVLSDQDGNDPLAKISNIILGPEKKIRVLKNGREYRVESYVDAEQYDPLTLEGKEYRMFDPEGNKCLCAHPHYAAEDDPEVNGWPINRLPRIDTLEVDMKRHYILTMYNPSNYALKDDRGNEVLKFMHRGLIGGWTVEDEAGFTPEILCALFTFSRYLEHENEFVVV